MPPDWDGEFPPEGKRKASGRLNNIPVIREVDYRPAKPLNHISKFEVPKLAEQRRQLGGYRAAAKKVLASKSKYPKGVLTTKEFYQRVVGADLVPILDGGCDSGLKESGSYLWAELCTWRCSKTN